MTRFRFDECRGDPGRHNVCEHTFSYKDMIIGVCECWCHDDSFALVLCVILENLTGDFWEQYDSEFYKNGELCLHDQVI